MSILDFPTFTVDSKMGKIVLLPRDGKRIEVFSLNTWHGGPSDEPFTINGVQYRLRADVTLDAGADQGVKFDYFNIDKQHSNKYQDYSTSAYNKAAECVRELVSAWAFANEPAMRNADELCKQQKREALEEQITAKEKEIAELRAECLALT